MNQLQLSGILLAGGQSRRMKSEKSLVLFQNKPLYTFPLSALEATCNEIFISANSDHFKELDYPVVPDEQSNGPISGIIACLKKAKNEFAVVIPTDTPFIDEHLIRFLFTNKDPGNITVAFNNKQQMEPLCAIYPVKLLKQIQNLEDQGVFKLYDVIKKTGYKRIDIRESLFFFKKNYFYNVNRPEDLSITP